MGALQDKLNYWRRIGRVYILKTPSYITFWKEKPAISQGINPDELGAYYMTFEDKAGYQGPKDKNGVILLNYFGEIGEQYNPLAIAQYGLAHWNTYKKTKDQKHFLIAKTQAEWLVKNLEPNAKGVPVWKHKFRWRYKEYLMPGWYSAHSQGAGISLLARVYKETGEEKYLTTAKRALQALRTTVSSGGVQIVDDKNDIWLEEYIVDPPTHILNGMIWGLWGVWDFYLLTKDDEVKKLFDKCVETIKKNIARYDLGFWSKYDLSELYLPMIASHFYNELHVVQLKIMNMLTKEAIFDTYASKFEMYGARWWYRVRARMVKSIFKIIYF